MSRSTFQLILLVSCTHALVHVFELSLPSVEQMIGDEFGVGRDTTGMLGTVWRIPFGVGALFAGWLVDRYGSRPLLLVYLLGCGAACLLASSAGSLNSVFVAMLMMGCFASIYHPAGLSLISRETTPETRGAALGWHGIFGSAGIASAPFIAGMVFSTGDLSWRNYYQLLAVPAALLALLVFLRLRESFTEDQIVEPKTVDASLPADKAQDSRYTEHRGNWRLYAILLVVGVLSGFIYAAFMHFLPRYLDGSQITAEGVSAEGIRNRLAALVLACGILGQSIAGRLAKPGRLPRLLMIISFANAPLLFWMAVATGPARVWATCLLAVVHFMNQPVYNSLIAQFVPVHRRSVGYGFSNFVCFALGGLGAAFAGMLQSDLQTYASLGVVAIVSGCVAVYLSLQPTI